MKKEYSAGIIVYFQEASERHYLILQYAHGHWDFAKGHIEEGESKHEAAVRELQEETGIAAVKLNEGFEETLSYIFTNREHALVSKTVYFFTGSVSDKAVDLSHEHIDYQWLPYKAALKQLTFKNARDMLKKVEGFLS